ncbi:MAG: threonine synthase, partial [Lachnospiraceae bacterium]|nr:threonine synthase [Lachnospiraceae bacterium]
TIPDEMTGQLAHFQRNYADEQETAKTIHDLYDRTGYVIDTHTAVAACVYGKYKEETKDTNTTVIASTASPYKFTRSVINAIDCQYDAMEDFELVDKLAEISGVEVPKAIEEIRKAPVLHDHICEKTQMKQMVMDFLGI